MRYKSLYYVKKCMPTANSILAKPILGITMEQRKYFRAKLDNTEVHISDGAGFCSGTLKDCSRFGICITNIPRKLHTENGFFLAVVSKNAVNFRLKVKEQWETKDGLSIEIGAAIDNAPWDWTEMIMQIEPSNDDIWATH